MLPKKDQLGKAQLRFCEADDETELDEADDEAEPWLERPEWLPKGDRQPMEMGLELEGVVEAEADEPPADDDSEAL